jgi:tetratricopeptide (TPR) repeat protein
MKTNLFKKAVLILSLPVIYFLIVSGMTDSEKLLEKAKSISDAPFTKDFINLIFTDTYFGRVNPNDPRAIENNLSNFRDSLHFNSIHVYGYDTTGGGFNSQIGWYSPYVSGLMDSVRNSGLRGFYGRNKIERLSYGQRLEYEAEGGNSGFSYQRRTASVISDSGRTVVHACLPNQANCPETDETPRYLCDSIYENLQHGDLIDFTQLDTANWFIKPTMRIDSNIVDSNPEDSVARIDVINYSGNIIKSVKIKARNFAKKINGNYIYSGKYVNDFDFSEEPLGTNLQVEGRTYSSNGLNYGMRSNPWYKWKDSCHVDFKVWWYGKVEVWFDKMIVDDEWGNNLFHPVLQTRLDYENRITEEAAEFTDNIEDGSFFIDELTHSQIPCVKRVYELMKQANPAAKLNFAVTNYFNIRSHKDNNIGHRELLKGINSESFSADAHEFQDIIPNTLNSSLLDPHIPSAWLRSKLEYNSFLQNKFFGDKSKETGIDPIEGHWAADVPSNWGSLVYQIELARQQRDSFSSTKKFIMQPQIHGVLKIENNYFVGGIREPLNEEIEAQAMLSIAHGADGICWFVYYGTPTNFKSGTYKIYGLLNLDSPYVHRHSNHYGQDKWNAVGNMNMKIENWKPTLDNTDWINGWSVHKDGANHEWISDIKSIYRNPSSPYSFSPSNEDTAKYWEMGFFNPDFNNPDVSANDKSKYFVMVNRRCVPESYEGIGDIRQLKIKFDTTDLGGFTNWKIIDVNTNNSLTFNKHNQGTSGYLDLGGSTNSLGYFNPGEGKLYKIAPVMQEGGTLVTDEDCGGFEFDCKGEVNNNGMSVNIKPGTTINFTSTSARINMDGGDFTTGNSLSETSPVYLRGKNGSFWKGLFLDECGEVEIATTYFENISPYPVDSTYAVQLIDCEYINITNSHFTADLDIKTGGILINYTSVLRAKEAYINYNYFQMDAGDMPALSVTSSGYVTFPLIAEGNVFESYTGNSLNAVFLSGVAGGAIKENQITGYKNGVILLWAEMDIYGNNIIGSEDDSKGFLCYASSYTNLSPNGFVYTGGLNSISCEGENSACIESDNSFLYLDYGYNTFDLKNYDPGNAFHLTGSVNEELVYEGALDETLNCFMVSETETTAVHNVTYGFSDPPDPVDFYFDPYYCGDQESEGMIVFNLGNGNYDSLLIESSGGSGGVSNYQLSMFNDQSQENVEIISVQALEDSVSINIRKRDYERVSELCYDLLTQYIDSLRDVSTLTKLYLAELKLDSAGEKISDLKSFLENLILNNPEKESLIEQSFYIIQKCKVSLGLYESAMSGFQEIVNQNPYSYEGLIASWDYAATSLLENSGSSGGFKEYNFDEENFIDDPADKYDKRKFTVENRISIRKNILNSFQTKREKEAEKVKSLEKKIRDGNSNKTETNELRVKTILNDVIKIKKPVTTFEHISIVNTDIQKVFGTINKNSEANKTQTLIPNSYSLSQNYPNPFNPITKINFDLSHEGKVKLIVYDLLGREIQKLVNNEFRAAGRHLMEFNGNNLSSGVYFYRLEVNDFVQTRRMILVK